MTEPDYKAHLLSLLEEAEALLQIVNTEKGNAPDAKLRAWILQIRLETLLMRALPEHSALATLRQNTMDVTQDRMLTYVGLARACLSDIEAGIMVF